MLSHLLLGLLVGVGAFTAPSTVSAPAATVLSATSATRSELLEVSRRASLQRLVLTPLAIAAVAPAAFAEDGAVMDLDAPSPEEIEKARLARKLAMQNKDKPSEKKGFAASLAAEQNKERAIKKKSKQEQREDLCEMLGRGC